jgi:hypothetical protein
MYITSYISAVFTTTSKNILFLVSNVDLILVLIYTGSRILFKPLWQIQCYSDFVYIGKNNFTWLYCDFILISSGYNFNEAGWNLKKESDINRPWLIRQVYIFASSLLSKIFSYLIFAMYLKTLIFTFFALFYTNS